MTYDAEQDLYDDFDEESLYDPEQYVADFIAEHGELGNVVLDAFDTTDPLGRHAEDEAEGFAQYPDNYLGEARKFIGELRLASRHVRTSAPGEAEALIAELARRSFDPWVVTARQWRSGLERSLPDLASQLHAAINLADHLPR
jgi:hypothetical protein